jgi:hypothetical protein
LSKKLLCFGVNGVNVFIGGGTWFTSIP